jgi:acetyl-CoA/propionyl-CoA carboxylase biotin carboxyl carrier protein
VVGTDFDPLLAKVIAHGPDRATALGRLDRGLANLEILGVATNAAFTRGLLARDDVRAGALDTGLLERVLAAGVDGQPEDLVPAAAVAAAGTASPAGPWRRRFEDHGELRVSGGRVSAGGRTWRAELSAASPESVRVSLDGISRRYLFAVDGERLLIARAGHHLELRPARPTRSASVAAGSLEAPMPGTVLVVRVANGDDVEEGQELLVIESMKMELSIVAPHAGTVEGLALAVGDRVKQRQALVAVTR